MIPSTAPEGMLAPDWVNMIMDRLHVAEAAVDREIAFRRDRKLILCKDPTLILCDALRALLLSRVEHEVVLDFRQKDRRCASADLYTYLHVTHLETGATPGTPSFRYNKLVFRCDRIPHDLPVGTFSGEEIDEMGLVDRLMGSRVWELAAIWAHNDLMWGDTEHYNVQPFKFS